MYINIQIVLFKLTKLASTSGITESPPSLRVILERAL